MSDRVVQLTDKDSNNIYPMAGGMLANSVSTGMIADAAITNAKIDWSSIKSNRNVNEAIFTANNIAPSADTPTAWVSAMGGDGYYVTLYTSSVFAHQPTASGQLVTFVNSGSVYQRWHSQPDGEEYYRAGNWGIWFGNSNLNSTFRKVLDGVTSHIPRSKINILANANLNTLTYCQPGDYTCLQYSTAQTLTNCPTGNAFEMTVDSIVTNDIYISSDLTHRYLVRKITDDTGDIWTQEVRSDGSANWVYSTWKKLLSSDDQSFSLTEKDTGCTWVDGKKIYSRAFVGTVTNTANQNVITSLWDNSPIDTLIEVGGYVEYGNGGKNIIPMTEGNEYRTMNVAGDSHNLNLRIQSSVAFTNRQYKVWIKYTKN